MAELTQTLSYVSIAFGVLLYIASLAGLWGGGSAGPADVGAGSTAAVFVLLGVGGLLLVRAQASNGQ